MSSFSLQFAHKGEVIPKADDYQIAVFNDLILWSEEKKAIPPQNLALLNREEPFLIGKLHGKNCFAYALKEEISPPEGFKLLVFRELFSLLNADITSLISRAMELIRWYENSQFCGKCGSPTEPAKEEIAFLCPSCHNLIFPTISVAIIVMIIKENSFLLAHNSRFPEGLYSCVAGFIEAGESAKNAISREVFEEVGIKIKNIRSFGTQHWTHPYSSLMLAYFAEYDSGEIKVDNREILDAKWFSFDNMPPMVPSLGSMARTMIEAFREGKQPL